PGAWGASRARAAAPCHSASAQTGRGQGWRSETWPEATASAAGTAGASGRGCRKTGRPTRASHQPANMGTPGCDDRDILPQRTIDAQNRAAAEPDDGWKRGSGAKTETHRIPSSLRCADGWLLELTRPPPFTPA